MGTSLMASNTQLIPAVTGLNPDLDNVTHLEAQSDSTEGFEGYPGIWMTSLKMQYIASGLMDTIYDNQLDEDGVLRRSAGAKTSQEDLDFQKVITSKTASSDNCIPVKKCLSMSYLDVLKKHEDTGNTSHRSRSLDSFSVIGVPTSTSKVSHGTELKLTPLPKVVSASSSLYAMSNCSSLLEYTSIFNVSGLVPTPPEGEPKVRLPWCPMRRLWKVPKQPPNNLHVYRNPLNFPTETMRSTSPSPSEDDSPTPEEAQRPRAIDRSGEESVFETRVRTERLICADVNLLAAEIMLSAREDVSCTPGCAVV
ncbi:unnamed protein product [Coregonus sp. 'balchen']|nr:unnamed protein product [Coregonus sp. 'balchen']